MALIAENLASIQARIERACMASGREPQQVRLLPMSKNHSVELIKEAFDSGIKRFGESRPQELAEKKRALCELGIEFTLAGQLQTNKTKLVAETADEFQALSSLKVAAELNRRCRELGRQLDVLVQVNTSGEPQKNGIAPDEALSFARQLAAFDALHPRGFMTLAVLSPDQQAVVACFNSLVAVRERVREAVPGNWDELSMGMSNDFELAIACGSTCVRIGTAIFGGR